MRDGLGLYTEVSDTCSGLSCIRGSEDQRWVHKASDLRMHTGAGRSVLEEVAKVSLLFTRAGIFAFNIYRTSVAQVWDSSRQSHKGTCSVDFDGGVTPGVI
jgi:hypothetical protein